MSDKELIEAIEEQRTVMVEVSTGGYLKIDEYDPAYRERRALIRSELARRGIDDPNDFASLRRWYDRWSKGDLPHYKDRRTFLKCHVRSSRRKDSGGLTRRRDIV